MDRTFYYANDHQIAWSYDTTFGRWRDSRQQGWQFGISVNFPDNVAGYDGIHDDRGRAEYNLGVAGYTPHAGDISGYWPGQCESNCGEDWAIAVEANTAVVEVWYR